MFRNPGGKIKSYAKVLFWIGVVISIIIGVIEIGSSFVAAAYSYQGSFGTILLGILGGILTVAIGTLISWLAVLTLYAFGTLVENSDELVRLNGGIPSGDKTAEKIEVPEKMHQTLHNIQTEPVVKATPEKQTEEPVEEVKEEPAEVVDAPVEETSTADEKTVEENAETEMNEKVCPNCGEHAEKDAHFCRKCGTKLD
ncbi:MAG: zinc ribbon domain-containing protein [Bulleidia sp.]|nr:zinc ribbon domain-containing protein [Bulleidia sp.]